jgi:hypothetical protein
MTTEEQIKILQSCQTREEFIHKCEYRRGREEAIKDIQEGRPDLTSYYPYTESLFGEAWTKGYTEYYKAWQILNQQ